MSYPLSRQDCPSSFSTTLPTEVSFPEKSIPGRMVTPFTTTAQSEAVKVPFCPGVSVSSGEMSGVPVTVPVMVPVGEGSGVGVGEGVGVGVGEYTGSSVSTCSRLSPSPAPIPRTTRTAPSSDGVPLLSLQADNVRIIAKITMRHNAFFIGSTFLVDFFPHAHILRFARKTTSYIIPESGHIHKKMICREAVIHRKFKSVRKVISPDARCFAYSDLIIQTQWFPAACSSGRRTRG